MEKRYVVLIALIGLLGPLFAQQALWGEKPVVSPEIHKDKTVTFRLNAPNASRVEITGDFLPAQKIVSPFGEFDGPGIVELKKTENGIWEYTTPASLAPELYSYSFLVDGLKINDPANVYRIRDVATTPNVFMIDGERADLYKVNSVPHGSVSRRWYPSPKLGMDRRLTIYTPPGYEESDADYPVLYLLHGMGGDEEAWIALGRTSQILDNLIASGKGRPMIVVMTNGNAAQEAAPGESSSGFTYPTMQLPLTMDGTFETAFPDVVDFVDRQYRTDKSKQGRAIAGLSMGGYHSLHISKQYPDLFDYVGLFSAAIFPNDGVTSPIYEDMDKKLEKQFAQAPALYWIAIGDKDFLYKQNQDYRNLLNKNGYGYVYYETPDGHIWKNWRIYLTEFVPMLFK